MATIRSTWLASFWDPAKTPGPDQEMMEISSPTLHINASRLQSDFAVLSAIGAMPDGGVNRPALSEAHLTARAWYSEQIRRAGLELRVDEAGNHSAVLRSAASRARTLLLGSHLDSVPGGGRYDGTLG